MALRVLFGAPGRLSTGPVCRFETGPAAWQIPGSGTRPFGLEVLPEAAGDQRLLPAARERGRRLEVVAADHYVEVQACAVDTAALPLLARVAEARAEREVRSRVLVEQ